jgi:divalent metal cation (Fe/Co/Zn/Cd) transporter
MAHRLVAAVPIVLGIWLIPNHPLISLTLFGVALALVANRHYAFGSGRYRAILGFISALWLGVLGAATTLLGLVPNAAPCEPPAACTGGNFLLVPGLLLLGLAFALLAWSVVSLLRMRRYG